MSEPPKHRGGNSSHMKRCIAVLFFPTSKRSRHARVWADSDRPKNSRSNWHFKGPFTHAIFDAISGAISRTKRALPYPARIYFREASRGLERKLSHIISRHPSFQFLPTWRYFVAELRDYKPVRSRLWQVLFAKSHRNRMKNRMCKRALRATFCSHRESPDSFNFFESLKISPKIPFDELFLKTTLKTSSDIYFFEKLIEHRKSRFSSVNYARKPNITEFSRKAQFDSYYSQSHLYLSSTCATW